MGERARRSKQRVKGRATSLSTCTPLCAQSVHSERMSLSASASGSGSGSGLLLASGSAAAAPSFAPPSSPTKAATGANGGVILPGEGNLWSSILDSVKTTKAVQSKQCIVLGQSANSSPKSVNTGALPRHGTRLPRLLTCLASRCSD